MPNAIHMLLAMADGGSLGTRVAEGIYLRSGFGGTEYVPGWDEWPEVACGPYGVCDNYEQVLKLAPELTKDPSRTFVLFLTPVRKSEQPAEGGWRWHKWGEYIGDHTPTTEYLYDEPEVDEVFCYHVYEKP